MFSLGLDRSSLIDSWTIFQSDRFGNHEAGASVGRTCWNFYTDFTLWETFRNLRPVRVTLFANGKSLFRLHVLLTLLNPQRRINAQNADRRERPRKSKGQKGLWGSMLWQSVFHLPSFSKSLAQLLSRLINVKEFHKNESCPIPFLWHKGNNEINGVYIKATK